jgi:glyoxylase-like metal-dependent hydrolase (beta-lactamase superfamily II)
MSSVTFDANVHLVASGRLGLGISDDHDCNVYLVTDGDDAVLVDAGCGLDVDRLARRIKNLGTPPVSRILLTHAHADHAAGAGVLAAYLGAEIWSSEDVADILEAGDAERAGLPTAKAAGLYPSSLQYPATRVARRLGAETLVVGGLRIEAVETPGHAVGHLAFLAESGGRRSLFSGDLVFSRGRVVVPGTAEADIGALAASIEAVAELRPNALFAGHAEPVLSGAGEHLAVACRAFRAGNLPPPLS